MKQESFLLMVNVYQEKVLEEVMLALTEAGVKDVFSLTGVNETRRLPHNISIFSGFKGELGKTSSLSRVFYAVVNDSNLPHEILLSLKNAEIDFLEDDLGSIVLLPVHSYFFHLKKR